MQHSSAAAAAAAARVNVEQKTIAGDSQWASVRAGAADREGQGRREGGNPLMATNFTWPAGE